jgi:hypothetical protein
MRAYDFDLVHATLVERFNGDIVGLSGASYFITAVHFGDVGLSQEVATLILDNVHRAVVESRKPSRMQTEAVSLVIACVVWPFLAYHVDLLTPAQHRGIEDSINESGFTWSGAEDKLDLAATTLFRNRGDTTQNQYIMTCEHMSWMSRCGHVLVAKNLPVSSAEILSSLPSVEDIITYSMPTDKWSVAHASHGVWVNLFIAVASVCEKLKDHKRVLVYTEAALEPEVKAGSRLPNTLVIAHTLRGRAFAALGRRADAGRAFEAAVEQAHACGFWLLEAAALADLKLLVFDQLGHGDHAARRLGAALRRYSPTGPPEKLTAIINGLNAAELMCLPPPDASYPKITAVDDQKSAALSKLRAELDGLRPLALQKRATSDGVSEADLEGALESADPKAALIELLLKQHASAASADDAAQQALRSELDGLKLMALQKRAAGAGVSDDDVEDAMETDDPKQAVIDLLLQQQHRSKTDAPASDRPHFGSGAPSSASASATASPSAVTSKHVMLSYQWDHQVQVKRAYDLLTKLGINCWMDIAGGMSGDIYESMANAVSNASLVVCFMSQKYQESENCMLELKFAKQSGVGMIPVMMEGDGWRPSGWLGLITAGSLWTRLNDDSGFEGNVHQLHGQI